MDKVIILELLKQYQRQYRIALEIGKITEELGQAVSRNDDVSLHLILEMRQQSIAEMQDNRAVAAGFLERLDISEHSKLENLLKNPEKVQPESWEEEKLQETFENIKSALRKAIDIDKRINLKIGEKKSFYYSEDSK